MNEIPFYVIDDAPEGTDEHLGLSVGFDPEHQMILLTQGDPLNEEDTDLVVLSLSELKRFLLLVKNAVTEEGTIQQIEAYSVQ